MTKILDKYSIEIIIPAKVNSSRIVNKNYRPFYNNKSLFEIKLEQVKKLSSPEKIHVFSDNEDPKFKTSLTEAGIKLHLIDTPLPYWYGSFGNFLNLLPDSQFVMTCFLTTPFINDKIIKDLFLTFLNNQLKSQYDSIATVVKVGSELFSPDGQIFNFKRENNYRLEYSLTPFYELYSGVSIINRAIANKLNYHIGNTPFLYEVTKDNIDLNTMEDWEFCQRLLNLEYYQKLL